MYHLFKNVLVYYLLRNTIYAEYRLGTNFLCFISLLARHPKHELKSYLCSNSGNISPVHIFNFILAGLSTGFPTGFVETCHPFTAASLSNLWEAQFLNVLKKSILL